MKPKPLASLNHFTVPYCMTLPTSSGCDCTYRPARDPHTRPEYAKPERRVQSPGEQGFDQGGQARGGRGDVGKDLVQRDHLVHLRPGASRPVGDNGQAGVVEAELA